MYKQEKKSICRRWALRSVAILAFVGSSLMAQTGNLNRPYEPVILNGSSFAAFSNNVAPVNQLFLYVYKNSSKTWEQISWQIDEVEPDSLDATKTTYFRQGDGKLDDLDELSFMAGDAGDKAPADIWLDDASARSFPRYEIELTDPLVSGSKGYAYLYRSGTLSTSPSLPDYISYDLANDLIRAKGYEEGHLANGIQNSILVPVSEGGSNSDFLDRLKLRVQIKSIFTITIDENSFNKVDVKFRDGRIRVIRELTERIALINVDIPLLIKYYGNSFILNTSLNLTSVPGVALLRQSFDFAPNVTGAKWYNQNLVNPVTVDGVLDNLTDADLAIVNQPRLNWYMMSSAHGSFINIFSVPKEFGASQKFYYRDAPEGSNDNTPDTGDDNKSFGDSGLWISGTNITGIFPLVLTSYILGKDQPRSVGENLRSQAEQPLGFSIQAQNYTTGVADAHNAPARRFALQQSYPNPVLLSQPSSMLIRYELPWSEPTRVELSVYNLLGQKLRELVNTVQTAGYYETQWDGRLENGEPAPAGIYFYQLRAGQQTITQKLMLISTSR
ncbi:MAG: T9SS type A sorting domain-containing protein [candidate division KSB1 bacterium]|nr:T9SS type A sorting domain-containing protein [candidate division KSB1 bacterium]MDZ7301066.1 T9SS type A sorting domain-containing protein [candidate division KSB1 bacterium]MDZ7312110.1 T9SS type A sorting domain-containing protein [candidate division KSB1 bacterium]